MPPGHESDFSQGKVSNGEKAYIELIALKTAREVLKEFEKANAITADAKVIADKYFVETTIERTVGRMVEQLNLPAKQANAIEQHMMVCPYGEEIRKFKWWVRGGTTVLGILQIPNAAVIIEWVKTLL